MAQDVVAREAFRCWLAGRQLTTRPPRPRSDWNLRGQLSRLSNFEKSDDETKSNVAFALVRGHRGAGNPPLRLAPTRTAHGRLRPGRPGYLGRPDEMDLISQYFVVRQY